MADRYTGYIENGVVKFDEETPPLPDGFRFRLIPLPPEEANDASVALARAFSEIAGTLEGLPEDMAEQHDHYLHRTPKI